MIRKRHLLDKIEELERVILRKDDRKYGFSESKPASLPELNDRYFKLERIVYLLLERLGIEYKESATNTFYKKEPFEMMMVFTEPDVLAAVEKEKKKQDEEDFKYMVKSKVSTRKMHLK